MVHEESQQRLAAHFRVLAESSQHFAEVSGVPDLLAAVVKRLGEVIGEGCSVWIVVRDGRLSEASATASYHPDADALAAFRTLVMDQPVRPGQGITGSVIATGKAILVTRVDRAAVVAQVSDRLRPHIERLAVTTVLAVPLRVRERILGAITLFRSDGSPPYTVDDQELAQDLADRAALAVENALLVHELERSNEALRRSENRLHRLAQSGLIGIIVSDLQGRIVEVNDALATMTGYDRADLESGHRTLLSLVRPEQHADVARKRERLAVHGILPPAEREYVRKDGSLLPVLVGAARLEEESAELIAVVLDLSDQKRAHAAEHALAAQAAEAEVLRREKDAAEDANRELESFSYSVAHDLRTPLRAINGFVTALAEDHGPGLDANAIALIDRVKSSTRQMSDLIDALLGLAKLSRAEIHWQVVDLAAIARTVVEELHALEPGRCVVLVAPPRLEAHGDPRLLRALLENVLGNAWKFTRARSEARIELFVTDDVDGRRVHLRDNGAGFDMAYADKLFAPFQRLHAQAEFDGSGVGLATVDRIVRLHGGEVTAAGHVDAGATITFTLPPPPAT